MFSLAQIPDDATCGTCRWYSWSNCRRFAPKLITRERQGRATTQTEFAETDEDSLCGEWTAKPNCASLQNSNNSKTEA